MKKIETRLLEILAADATLAAAFADRMFAEVGSQRPSKPYLVLKIVAEIPLWLQEGNPLLLRHWHFQVSAVADGYDQARTLSDRFLQVLVATNDRPVPGIQSILHLGSNAMWWEPDRAYQSSIDIDIRENLAD